MMKWGRKKPSLSSPSASASSSSQPHLISHVFPLSWFSKSKQSSKQKPGSRIEKTSKMGTQNPQRLNPRSPKSSNSTYYTQDDEGFWRLSFGDQNPESNTKQSETKRRSHRSSNKNHGPRFIEATSVESDLEEWEKEKEAKMREFMGKGNEKQRKSFHMARQGKVRVQSPKTPSKIKALENLKKMKMKKKMKEITVDDNKTPSASLESFAVVKCSQNPRKDFRDSMLEMIMEKSIRRPEELEELLACYLTLNADEYHDLIIKVFREVWIEIEDRCFDDRKLANYFVV